MKNLKTLRQNIESKLNETSEKLLEKLNKIFDTGWPKEAEILDFVRYVDSFSVGFYPMTKEADQVRHEKVLDDILYGEDFTPDNENWGNN